jgi:hypothetical protein
MLTEAQMGKSAKKPTQCKKKKIKEGCKKYLY